MYYGSAAGNKHAISTIKNWAKKLGRKAMKVIRNSWRAAGALLVLLGASAMPARAADRPPLVSEDMMVPSPDAGIQLFVRNKHPADRTDFGPERTVLFVHGATYPADTSFDLKLGDVVHPREAAELQIERGVGRIGRAVDEQHGALRPEIGPVGGMLVADEQLNAGVGRSAASAGIADAPKRTNRAPAARHEFRNPFIAFLPNFFAQFLVVFVACLLPA